MREKDIENTRLIHSLTNVFLDVYELDLETELIHIIRTEQDDMRLLKTEEIDFSTFKRFLLQNVPEEKKKSWKKSLKQSGFAPAFKKFPLWRENFRNGTSTAQAGFEYSLFCP